LSTEEVMEAVQLSRGNVNINMRELINWNLVAKQTKLGERKEFFVAGHDVWNMAKNIAQERKRRELMPVRDLLSELLYADIEGDAVEVEHFKTLLSDLDEFVKQMDQLSDLLLKINNNALFKRVVKTLGSMGKMGE
jgi:DNA-binding transcriptional regulator GbsR (MarR family)